ncbi:MAG: AAA family ATPase [Ignavibacteria bacterium RBG_16_36_9]|nr:MAG: AAA family ATPase [Ignavibacteria bacterium RBG_16_36_9]
MILKETIAETVNSQKELILRTDKGIEREMLSGIKLTPGYAAVISGIRRTGKSTLLRQLIAGEKEFAYLNFEDVRIFGFELKDFKRLEDIFSSQGSYYLYFFDELQNVEGWERYIRTLLDNKNTVVITGSNASLLSKELGSKLTGRHLRYELFPFSFKEFLSFKGIKPSLNNFEEYLQTGGMPEHIKLQNDMILQELFNDIIARDITVRYNLRNPKLVKELALYLLSNIGKEFSFQKLRKMYDLGSVNTVIALIGYYEDSYLLFTVPQFDFSLRSRLVNAKKVYAIDTGLIRANSVSFSQDRGRMLENIVFIQLKRIGREVFYFKKNNECDFIARDANKNLELFQVCFELNEDNKDREINGMLAAMEYTKLKTGTILTLNQTDELDFDNKKIIVMPVWQWLIQS